MSATASPKSDMIVAAAPLTTASIAPSPASSYVNEIPVCEPLVAS